MACVGQLLRHMEGRERPAQFACECLVPVLTGQLADFAFGPKAGEQGLGRPRSRLGLDLPLGAAQDDDEVPRCLCQELRSPVGLRPADHLAQRLLGDRRLPLGQRDQRGDAQILSLCDGIGHAAADRPNLIQLATRIPKGLHREIKLFCVQQGLSVMEFVAAALEEKLRKSTVRAGRRSVGR